MANANATETQQQVQQQAEKRIGLFSTFNAVLRMITTSVNKTEQMVANTLDSGVKMTEILLQEASMMSNRSRIENDVEMRQLEADMKLIEL
jgi:hypothetical protein